MHACKWLDSSGRLASCGVHVLKKGDRCHGDAGAGRGVGGKARMQNGWIDGIDGSMDRCFGSVVRAVVWAHRLFGGCMGTSVLRGCCRVMAWAVRSEGGLDRGGGVVLL
jgi:hypothetical protein